ncbi:type II toxin-antitoxin system HicB family antitoxin [Sulfobacillus thermosulfidooxidans]|uniref:type II toxin-antitoxin system HicB family antitoxin n=1 Tax=Sulfobacillus thermosulfidooxidans TaxID=28034 RepID=UPI0006B68D2D|nr:type II toxin-antitoxin system HicB family antitoxin [Sulfobacillus thermosulfidooxidans]
MARYTVIVEKGDHEYFAYVPALPGCTSAGQTPGEALDRVIEAIHLTQSYMTEHHIPLPQPIETIAEVEVN